MGMVKCGYKPEICEDLKPVADSQDEIVSIKEFFKVFPQVVSYTVCVRIAGAGIIPVRKSSGKDEQTVIRQPSSSGDKIIDMDYFRIHTRVAEHFLSFHFRINPIPAHDERFFIGPERGRHMVLLSRIHEPG
jgi:hypothetical protein